MSHMGGNNETHFDAKLQVQEMFETVQLMQIGLGVKRLR